MPTAPFERITLGVLDEAATDSTQVQVKTCSNCRTPIPPDGTAIPFSLLFEGVAHNDTSIVCRFCQERSALARGGVHTQESFTIATDLQGDLVHGTQGAVNNFADPISISTISAQESDEDVDEPLVFAVESHVDFGPPQCRLLSSIGSPHASKRTRVEPEPISSLQSTPKLHVQTFSQPTSSGQNHSVSASVLSPDPLMDITRLRVRSRGCHSLYPGALFQGTQKSGRNSYDVTVNIVDVDFESSTLCGYLCIRGLTDDWPELTTYFDAEIIGSRYGFRTRDWGATEQDDLSHWSCFPAFRHVKHEMQKPCWTVDDRDRGAVFMRWKERFLVPDHRVQDITGASFAGFYYVCVDFNPQPNHQTTRPVPQQMPLSPESATDMIRTKSDSPTRPVRRETKDGVGRRSWSSRRSRSRGLRSGPRPAATMSGYYFHQNSEPYQQLSLVHVPETSETSFEFR